MNQPFTYTLIKQSFLLDGRATSTCLEEWAWTNLKRIARERDMTLQDLIQEVHGRRQRIRLACALRAAVVEDLIGKAFVGASVKRDAAA